MCIRDRDYNVANPALTVSYAVTDWLTVGSGDHRLVHKLQIGDMNLGTYDTHLHKELSLINI